ncbi:MAG TPA: hypothetical protein VK176_10035 [Phycisphaerales bacterium]|nr:hypothetical protein [Phycisphaerales bacterium]
MQPTGGDPTRALIDAWPYLAGLLAIALVGGFLILIFRRSLLAKDSGEVDESLMGTLRKMRDTGQISLEEYEASIRSMAQRVSARKPALVGVSAAGGPAAIGHADAVLPQSSPPSGPKGSQIRAPQAPPSPDQPAVDDRPRQTLRPRPAEKPAQSTLPPDLDFPPLIELPPEQPGPRG